MAKPLLFAAVVAYIFMIVSSSADVHSYASSSASSSSSHASASAHSESFAITTAEHPSHHPPPRCDTSSTAKPCVTTQKINCQPTCKRNEVYTDCVQAQCGPKTCAQLKYKMPCPKIDPKCCTKGCICKKGYVKNKYGVCIPKDQCPPICGPYEVYSNCTQGNCAPQKCSQLGFPIPCPRIDPKYCKKGCLCKPGYVRDSAGVCIRVKNCPSCGGDPNAEGGECANNCGRLCSNYKEKNVVCTLECAINGCTCKKRYVYDSNTKRCVLPRDCTPVCREYEMYSECVNSPCPVLNCSQIGLWVDCLAFDTKDCIKGCVCQEPLMRQDDGSCVPIEKCKTPVCKKDEVYSECINGGCTAKNCSQIGRPIPCIKMDPKYCIKGCLCKEGYLREDNGTCVPEKLCKKNCNKPKEYYEPCGHECPSQSCSSIHKKQSCSIQTKDNCKPLCKCKDGYYRNQIGECITKEQCLKCSGPHEYYSCGGACDNVCKTLHKQNQTNCPIVNIKCNEMCYCEKDYARAKNGTCIPIKKCNEPQCGKHERYEKCPARLTEPQKCSQLGYPLPEPCSDDEKCPVKPACVCVDGYVRNDKGVCIRKKNCPSCGGDPNAQSGCGINCNKRCEDILKKPGACIALCKNNSCDCKKGYYYNKEKKKCVLPSDCDVCTKPNEYLELCDYGCPPNTCESLDRAYVCPIREGDKCVARCKCKPGFYRNINGDCITEEQCRKCNGPHEYYACGGACDNVCKTLHKQNQTNCPIVNIKCSEMCYCEKDYARAKNGTCIPIKKCNEPQCGKHERYEKCPARLTEPQKCSQLGYPLPEPCSDDEKCPVKPACVCVDGYVRNDKGVCIPKEHCPSCGGDPNAQSGCGINCNKRCEDILKKPGACILSCKINSCDCKKGYYYNKEKKKCVLPSDCDICTKANEYLELCDYGCPPNTCESLDRAYVCPIREGDKCVARCKCKPGFYRNINGDCITEDQCRKCNGPHEYYACGGACDNVCKTLHKQNQTNCPIVNIKCNEMCYCEKDYARAKNGTCIPIKKCNETQCGKHERYEKCPARLTEPQKCSQLGYPLPEPCPDDEKCPVKPACVCVDGYVRNHKGVCIPKEHCPSCGGDPNAQSGCGINCNKRCEDILKKPGACILSCKINSCDCKKGYYYNKEKKKCVLPSDCDVCTKPNEYLELCDYGCPPNTCESLDRAYVCPIREGDKCVARCKCKPGFYRNINGDCITEDQCRKCNGPHEYYACGGACDNVCKTLHKQNQTNCPIVNIKCNEMCYCEKDYARAKNGTCIPIKKCNEPQCGKHEKYEKCPARLTEPQKCSQLGYPLPEPCPDDEKCPVKPACVCVDGYVRNHKGVCIPKEHCPSCGGDPNAQSGCGINCNKRCEDILKKPGACILSCKINSCDCKKGYYYNKEKKKCVLPSDCDICTKANEYLELCDYGCPPNTCESLDRAYVCPIREGDKCVARCKCKPGFYRNINGDCITEDQCRKCNGPHEYYACGGACDNVCKTLHKQNQTNCPIVNIKCNEMCYCEKDYARAKNGTCIPIKKCNETQCGKHERYEKCPARLTEPQKCSQLGYPLPEPCPDDEKCPVKPACVCVDGYVRNHKGVCIPKEHCPSCGGDPNAQSGCGINCNKRCEDILKKPGACILSCKINSCDCKKGYYYNKEKKKCVLPSDCDVCTKPNEYLELCDYGCPPNTCESLDRAYVCPIREGDKCVARCKCKPGFYRNINGDCITEDQCRKCNGPHEYYACGGACDNVCKTLHKQNQTNCPIVNIKCNEMCYCEKDYARAKNGTCIPIKKCNEPQCGKHEKYEKCPARLTEPQKCSQLGYPLPEPCPDDEKCPVKPACVCVDGYVRNHKGVCIPKEHCPSCGGDPNAQSGCGINCNKRCEDILKKPGACILSCKINSCDCKKGYYYNKEKKKCVLPSDCDVCTKPNEYLELCDYGCPPNTCESLDRAYVCPIREGDKCVARCKCKPGFYRNINGDCITEDQCRKCNGPHEYYACGGACDNVCKTLHKQNQTNCPIVNIKCNEMCYCEKDYARAKNGTCIPIKKCNEPQCGKHERYEKCPARLTEPQKCSQLGYPLPEPCSDDEKCPVKPACVCVDGYVRNDKGVCIPKEHCPSCGGDPNAQSGCGINCNKRCEDILKKPGACILSCKINSCDCKKGYYYNKQKKKCVLPSDCAHCCPKNEIWDACVNGGCGHRNCSQLGGPILCIDPIECRGGCTCEKGYLRLDATGKCVPEDHCPARCPINEVWDSCVNGGCGHRNCSQLGGPILCIDPIECRGGCTCEKGYLRLDATGKCVPEDQCPESCNKPNEVYVKCPPNCPPQTCASLNQSYHCPLKKSKKNESDCVGECRCKEDFYRNLIGECISKEDCLKCTGDHEYFSCGPACDNVCCDLDTQSKDNCPIKNVKCVPRCYCEDGYARDKDGVCICISDCPR